jgi:uncharacterized protein YdhG (YjbR/CyaY superfamily)
MPLVVRNGGDARSIDIFVGATHASPRAGLIPAPTGAKLPSKKQPKTITEYIAGFPKLVAARMRQIRKLVNEEAPEAEEAIKYGMPTFMLNGNLVFFSAYKNHIGFYPVPHTASPELKMEMQPYLAEKSTLQFPHKEPLPTELIRKVVKARVDENAG